MKKFVVIFLILTVGMLVIPVNGYAKTDRTFSISEEVATEDPTGISMVDKGTDSDRGIQSVSSPVTLYTIRDSFLRKGAKDTNEGANPRLRIQASGNNRVVVGFDLSSVDVDLVTSATLVLTIAENADNWGQNNDRTVDAHPLQSDFTEGDGKIAEVEPRSDRTRGSGPGVTWNCPTDDDISDHGTDCAEEWDGGDFGSATALPVVHFNGLIGEVSWDVTSDVASGANNWLIKKTSESASGKVKYYSREGASEAGDLNLAPRLILDILDVAQIAFTSNRDTGGLTTDIYVMEEDGSSQTRITTHPAHDFFPAWSPDRSKIAFTSTRDGNPEIYLMDPDGTNLVRLTNDPAEDSQPAWSSDGSKIAFQSNRAGNFDVWVMNADGSAQTRLTFTSGWDSRPSWSPDGIKIAYDCQPAPASICIINSDGSGSSIRLPRPPSVPGNLLEPVWSPDGTKMAFMADYTGGSVEIFIMDPDGSNQVNLTNHPQFDGGVSWSPDGSKIAFHSNRDGDFEIWIMNADGSSPFQITSNNAGDVYPSWIAGGN